MVDAFPMVPFPTHLWFYLIIRLDIRGSLGLMNQNVYSSVRNLVPEELDLVPDLGFSC